MSSVLSMKMEWGGIARFRSNDGEKVHFTALDPEEANRRALVFGALYIRYDGLDVVGRDVVPTRIACSGRAVLAAYLFAAHELSITEVAERLEVEPSTVEQYLSDVRQGRR